jgi:two-component system, NarL family, response regulator NreC
MSIRVLIADDHRIVRDGIRALLEKHPDLQLVAEAENGREAVALAKKLHPQVIVMDLSMPDLNGMEATRQVVNEAPNVRVLALSMHADKRFIMSMLDAGASGYLLKDCAFEEFATAVRAVAAGGTYLSPRIAGLVVKDRLQPRPTDATSASADLTPKEREVLQLITEGKNTKEIASLLEISIKTVETHRQHMMGKLDVRSVAELTKFAIREGLTSLEL